MSQSLKKAVAAGIFLTITHLACIAFGYWYRLSEQDNVIWLLQDAVSQGHITPRAAAEAESRERQEHQRP